VFDRVFFAARYLSLVGAPLLVKAMPVPIRTASSGQKELQDDSDI